MLDIGHLPSSFGRGGNVDIQIFNRYSTVTNTQWLTWTKPRGKTYASIFALGGGGGGGGGFTAIAGNARGGGGGGACASQASVAMPLAFLPDILYIQVGVGGAGGVSGVSASAGLQTYVAIYPHTNAMNCVLRSANSDAGGGTSGSGIAAGGGGTAPTVGTLASCPLAAIGAQHAFVIGIVGASGGAQGGAVGVSAAAMQSSPQGLFVTPGAGGAGVTAADFAGGGFTASAGTNYISIIRPVAPAAGSNNGCSGFTLWQPFYNFGGCGGSSSNAGIGGGGGCGAYGSGGGGGGGGTTGGRGGIGGCGLVMITCW